MEFHRADRSLLVFNSTEKLRSEILNYVQQRLEEFSSEIKQVEDLPVPAPPPSQTDEKKGTSAFPKKTFQIRSSILTDLLEIPHIRSIRQIFISILVILVLQVIVTDLFETGTIDFRFDVIRWNFSNFPSCVRLWICLFVCTCSVVYSCFHYWSYKRLDYLNSTRLLFFDWFCLIGYCLYIAVFLYYPVNQILEENYPIATRIIILAEQVRFLMKSHAFVRENVPRAILYGQIYSQQIETDKNSSDTIPQSPCPEFSKFLYFMFVPTLIYRDSYPRTSSIRWKYVLSQLSQFAAASLFSYYLFYRFCMPVFRHFKSEHVTLKIFVLSILNCTLPGALLLFCSFYGFLHCWLNAFAEMLRFADRKFYSDWWTATSWSSYYRTWNIVVHDWLYTYIYRDCHKALGVKYRLVSLYTVIFLSACVHEYILAIAFGYFYPVLFLQFAILGFISMLILPQRTSNNAFNVFIWSSLFVGFGMQMCLYSIEWYARQNCPRSVNGALDYFMPRSFSCRDSIE